MEGLGLENIFGEEDLGDTLFTEPEETSETEVKESGKEDATSDAKENDNTTTEAVDSETLFEEEQPESVGSGQEKEEEEDATPEKDDGTSPTDFYSSIASALAEEGVFLNSEDEAIKNVSTPEDFVNLFEAEVEARLDARQRRISQALSDGVEPTDIRKYESTLNFIASVTDDMLSEESDKGEQLRKNILYQDFLNKGYTPEKAQKMTERAFDSGTDVEDAKEALQSNKEFFQSAYNRLLQNARNQAEAEKAERKKQAEKLQNSIMKDKSLFGDLDIDFNTRKKVYESIAKPVYRDPERGDLTAIQKYEMEHPGEFLKYAGLIFTLTNGFKDFSSFTKGMVKKQVRKGLRDLENKLNTTKRNTNGGLKMVTTAKEDPESWINGDFKLAL